MTLSLVNARTTEEEVLTEGYARKTDVSWGAGGGAGWWGGFAAAGGYGLPEYRDRTGDRARLSRRLQETGRPARRHPADAGSRSALVHSAAQAERSRAHSRGLLRSRS